MIVFKTYFKILKRYKWTVLLYTAILLAFGIFNMHSSENSMSFSPEKPDICIVNEDHDSDLTDQLISYLEKHCHLVNIGQDRMDDAVFYRDVHYVIYIPDHYGQDVLQGKEPVLDIKSTGDYQASLVEMVLERYLKVQGTLVHFAKDESQLVTWLDQTLRSDTSIVVDSEIDLEQQS